VSCRKGRPWARLLLQRVPTVECTRGAPPGAADSVLERVKSRQYESAALFQSEHIDMNPF